MFHPVGSQPPSVYWRRRLVLLASIIALLVLIVVTVKVVFSSDPQSSAAAANSTSGSPTPTVSPTRSSTEPPVTLSQSPTSPVGPSSPAGGSAAGGAAGSHTASSSVPPAPCAVSALQLAAATGQQQYAINAQPVLSILVTNPGTKPCVQDLADPQIELRVYNGESRVWSSHDCKIEPGTDPRTLMPGQTVRVSIVWSGLSSQPKCAGQRQRVGAGTYTLYASLAGREATAAQFTIS